MVCHVDWHADAFSGQQYGSMLDGTMLFSRSVDGHPACARVLMFLSRVQVGCRPWVSLIAHAHAHHQPPLHRMHPAAQCDIELRAWQANQAGVTDQDPALKQFDSAKYSMLVSC